MAPIRVLTLGTSRIEGSPGVENSPFVRRRALAALILAANSGPGGISRERVTALLWPDHEPDKGRNNLRQALFTLRRLFGTEVFIGDAHSLRIDPVKVTTDVVELDQASAQRDHVRVAALYGGTFLDGFFIAGLDDFDRWLESERSRLKETARASLQALTRAASMRGDHLAMVPYARRLVTLDPLSSRSALELLTALTASGDRPAALEYAQSYEVMVREQLDLAPDNAVLDFVKRLRADPNWQGQVLRRPSGSILVVPESAEPATTESPSVIARVGRATQEVTAAVTRISAGIREPVTRLTGRLSLRLLAGAGLATIVVAAGWRVSGGMEPERPGFEGVAVRTFTAVGDSIPGVPHAVASLLSSALDGAGGFRAWPETGSGAGYRGSTSGYGGEPTSATATITGSVVVSGERIRIVAELSPGRRSTMVPVRVQSEGARSDLFRVIDAIALQIIGQQFNDSHDGLSRSAAGMTQSLPALRQFAVGKMHLGQDRFAGAAAAFDSAIRLDREFALAYFHLSLAADAMGRDSIVRWAGDQASARSGRLGERERRYLIGNMARQNGHLDLAEEVFRDLATDFPDDPDALFQLGEVLAHGNPLRGRSAREARDAFARVLELSPRDADAAAYLARIELLNGRVAEANAIAARAARWATRHPGAMRSFRSFVLSDRASHKRITAELAHEADWLSAREVLQLVLTRNPDEVEQFASRVRRNARSDHARAFAGRLTAQAALARGQWQRALAQWDSSRAYDPAAALEQMALFAAQPFVPASPDEINRIHAMVQAWRPAAPDTGHHSRAHDGMHAAIRLHRLALLELRRGDAKAARQWSDSLLLMSASEAVRGFTRTLSKSVLAHMAAGEKRWPDALRLLDESRWPAFATSSIAEAADRYLRAKVLRALGREEEALGWLDALAERHIYEMPFLGPADVVAAEILEARGERDRSLERYQRVLELWREAGPTWKPEVRRLEQRRASMAR
jgi:DNA-binding SARP family transcriptional activator